MNDEMFGVFGISDDTVRAVKKAESDVSDLFRELDDICEYDQMKVLKAFQDNRISDRHFSWNTGYGYDDQGREATESVFADVFHTEAALVRTQIVNGTHALSLILTGLLVPGDEIIYTSGKPYDTLEEVIGIRGEGKGSLKEFGITYKQVELKADGTIDLDAIGRAITDKTKMVCLQRATGYAWRKAVTVDEIADWAAYVSERAPQVIKMVDNCYGEFLDRREPTDAGVDILGGSLIKNPGGGLALSGGYIAGKKELVDRIANRLYCAGIGGECGLTFGQTRNILQGLFMAPKVTNGAVKGAILCAKVFSDMGYDVCPKWDDTRSDIIEAVKLGAAEKVIAFCKGIQAAAPIDSHVDPEPWDMPGYDDQVIMAAGAFVQGSSIELSADAPVRPPYIVYFQGGLTYEHSKFGIMKALQTLKEMG